MAQPIPYISTFVPTDMQSVAQLASMYTRDINQRDQLFDQTAALRFETMGALGNMKTEDVAGKAQRIQALQSEFDKALERRGGDYGAASKDIARIISQERANPWYQFNTRQLEQAKSYRELQNKLGQNFYAIGDPTKVSYNQYQQDPNSLEFTYANKSDLKSDIYRKAQAQSKSVTNFINNQIGAYRELGYQHGAATTAAAQDWLNQNPQFIQDYMQSIGIDDPQLASELAQTAIAGLVGNRDTNFVQDPDYIANLRDREKNSTVPLTPTKTRAIEQLNKPFTTTSDLFKSGSKEYEIKARAVKDQIISELSDPNLNSNATENKVFLDYLKTKNPDELEAVRDINRVSWTLPTPKYSIGKGLEGLAETAPFIGSVVKLASKLHPMSLMWQSGKNLAGYSTNDFQKGLAKSFQDINTTYKEAADIEHPFIEYFKEKKNTYNKYNIDKMSLPERDKFFSKIEYLNNRAETLGDKYIAKGYGDYPEDFVDFNITTGNVDLDKETLARRDRLNEVVSKNGQVPLQDFTILQTSGDKDFKNIEKLRSNEELYGAAQNSVRISGITIDRELGPIYSLDTDNDKKGIDSHIATLSNTYQNLAILSAYGENNIPEIDSKGNVTYTSLENQYKEFLARQNAKAEYGNDINNLPKYREFKGGSIEDYLLFLKNSKDVSDEEISKATIALGTILNVPITTKIK